MRNIPTYDNGSWDVTSFKDDKSFSDFIVSIFKEPGKYYLIILHLNLISKQDYLIKKDITVLVLLNQKIF